MLRAVVSEAVVFGLVSELMKTSESKVKGVEAVCFASDRSGIAVIFMVCFGDIAPLVALLEVDLLGAIVANGKL